MTKSQNQAQASAAEYFNLQASGCGYLSRVRWVSPNKRGGRSGDRFLACAINALRGDVNDPAYTYFDLRVSGEEAIGLVEELQKDVDENRKVFVAFKLGDFYPHAYEREEMDDRRRPTGKKETATLIKGRLLLITYVKVDGEVVYSRDDDQGGESRDDVEASRGEADEQGQEAEKAPRRAEQTRSTSAHPDRRPAPVRNVVDRTRVRSYAETH